MNIIHFLNIKLEIYQISIYQCAATAC